MNRRSATLSLLATLVTAVAPAHANADASAPANATLDPRLLGRWVHQSMINSGGGAGGFASFTTERTIEFGADGLVQQWVRLGRRWWQLEHAGRPPPGVRRSLAGAWQRDLGAARRPAAAAAGRQLPSVGGLPGD